MSADVLRRAAAKLREQAEKAVADSPGPWVAEDDGLIWNGERATDPVGGSGFADNAKYFALMHPPVALAVAELLEVLATEQQTSNPFDLISAESLARAILREPS